MQGRVISGPFVGTQQKSLAERIARSLYHSTCRLQDGDHRSSRAVATSKRIPILESHQEVTVICISDTHNTFPASLPAGDVLLHAGDLSQYGTLAEIQKQLDWIRSQPHPHKVVIAGNHDLLLDSEFVAAHPDRELDCHAGQRRSDLDWNRIHYLQHSFVKLFIADKSRTIRLFGSPWSPRYGNFAFQYGQDEGFSWHQSIPEGTNIVLVHGPPKGHLDEGGKGCQDVLVELWRTRPKVVVCGHIHGGRGEARLLYDRNQANYETVAASKQPWSLCTWLSILGLLWCVAWCHLSSAIGLASGPKARKSTHLVNAAIVGGRGNSERREAINMRL